MAHKHSVYDTDSHFQINAVTRAIINVSQSKVSLMQYDHDSERFTFEMPRFIDGHDMMLCNMVQVHYTNTGTSGQKTAGVYEITDLEISAEDENILVCTWLISQNATQYVGKLDFLLRFICSTDGIIEYVWNTAVCSGISISAGMNNTDDVVDDYPDLFVQMQDDLGDMETAIDGIISIQNTLIGGDEE